MTDYLIRLGFTACCCAAPLIYWRRRLNRDERDARGAAQRVADDARRAEQEAALAEIDARVAKSDEFWIKRGFGPTPEPKEEPEEEPKPAPR